MFRVVRPATPMIASACSKGTPMHRLLIPSSRRMLSISSTKPYHSLYYCRRFYRHFASPAAPNLDSTGLQTTAWPEHEFVNVADACLEHISERVAAVGFSSDHAIMDFDAEFSQGVLTIALGAHGTYVLNTQTPNRQIWLSSPTSGPRRYAWHPGSCEWLSTRDGSSLRELLTSELSNVLGQDISLSFKEVLDSL